MHNVFSCFKRQTEKEVKEQNGPHYSSLRDPSRRRQQTKSFLRGSFLMENHQSPHGRNGILANTNRAYGRKRHAAKTRSKRRIIPETTQLRRCQTGKLNHRRIHRRIHHESGKTRRKNPCPQTTSPNCRMDSSSRRPRRKPIRTFTARNDLKKP